MSFINNKLNKLVDDLIDKGEWLSVDTGAYGEEGNVCEDCGDEFSVLVSEDLEFDGDVESELCNNCE